MAKARLLDAEGIVVREGDYSGRYVRLVEDSGVRWFEFAGHPYVDPNAPAIYRESPGPGGAPAPPAHDPVNRPAHYNLGGVEVISAIEAWGLNYHRGNAVKYVARAGKKDPAREVEDLKKARWYIEREIARLEKRA